MPEKRGKTMDTLTLQVVPRANWQNFFDKWSGSHQGELITLTGFQDGTHGRQTVQRKLPLIGISLDPRGSEAGHLIIMLGDTLDDNIEHILPDATEVRANAEVAVSELSYLQISRADGSTMTVQAGDA